MHRQSTEYLALRYTELWEIKDNLNSSFKQHKEMYEGTTINADTGAVVSSRTEIMKQHMRQGCPLSPTLFNIPVYIVTAVQKWPGQLKLNLNLEWLV
jgi:hypothetical protein